MGILGQAGVRKEPFDRTWTDVGVLTFTGAALAPAASTQRWTFTVPSNKRAILSYAQCWIYRVTAAAPVAEVLDSVKYTPSGGTIRDILVATTLKNAIADEAHAEFGSAFTMQAGDVIAGFTADGGTGGTVTHRVNAQVDQFDA